MVAALSPSLPQPQQPQFRRKFPRRRRRTRRRKPQKQFQRTRRKTRRRSQKILPRSVLNREAWRLHHPVPSRRAWSAKRAMRISWTMEKKLPWARTLDRDFAKRPRRPRLTILMMMVMMRTMRMMMVFSDNHTVLLPRVKIESERERDTRRRDWIILLLSWLLLLLLLGSSAVERDREIRILPSFLIWLR